MRKRIRRGLDTVREKKPYLQNLIVDLFSLGPESLLEKSPDIYRALQEGRLSRADLREVVETYRPMWDKAKSSDIYDAAISAGQAAAEVGTSGVSYPLGKLAEVAEMVPKAGYLYSYAKKAGTWPAVILGLYELATIVDPSELMDIAPAYTMSTLYLMRKKIRERIREKEETRPRRGFSTSMAQA
jgi:hypothetical protein